MYLKRAPKIEGLTFEDIIRIDDLLFCNEDEIAPQELEKVKPFITIENPKLGWKEITSKLGYWRKANHIHKWFVDHVQHGEDDCGHYRVSKQQLSDLLKTCKTVLDHSVLVDDEVQVGTSFEDTADEVFVPVPVMETGKVIKNTLYAERLLPVQSGFFFGGTNYDQWYYEDIQDTVKILEKALAEVDFDKEYVFYRSSW